MRRKAVPQRIFGKARSVKCAVCGHFAADQKAIPYRIERLRREAEKDGSDQTDN